MMGSISSAGASTANIGEVKRYGRNWFFIWLLITIGVLLIFFSNDIGLMLVPKHNIPAPAPELGLKVTAQDLTRWDAGFAHDLANNTRLLGALLILGGLIE